MTDPVDRLAEPVRRWIWRKKWTSLKDIQQRAIGPVLAGGDVILAAATAGGKTEAAFMPLISKLVETPPCGPGFSVLYVSPLKALINDQYPRLESMCEGTGLAVYPWHGDVAESQKSKARQNPSGIVLITPESLEAMLVRRTNDIPHMFGPLKSVVIDELHAFIGSERGIQLQSILSRIEGVLGRSIDRIGLSATLGDMRLAAENLRPGSADTVTIVEGHDPSSGLKVQIRGYVDKPRSPKKTPAESREVEADAEENEDFGSADRLIADDLFRALRGSRHLVFAGSRGRTERFADMLRTTAESQMLPNEFFAHHGNLAKGHREFVEERMREGKDPTTVVCTSTLELGIDIGNIESIAQVGAPFSVASLRQRLGRSGRRENQPAMLRMYCSSPAPEDRQSPQSQLHLELVQCIAMLLLLGEGWCEPPRPRGLHLSTLTHQILALTAQTGGLRARDLFRALCERGPFKTIDQILFAAALRQLARDDVQLIEQVSDGTILPAREGERLIENFRFYAVFQTPDEYRVVHSGKTLGTMPVDFLISEGQTIIFSARRWRIEAIDDRTRRIDVVPSRSALPPRFGGTAGDLHDMVALKMREVLSTDTAFGFLNDKATEMIGEARAAYQSFGLDRQSIVAAPGGSVIFTWAGTVLRDTLAAALKQMGASITTDTIALEIGELDVAQTIKLLERTKANTARDPITMAEQLYPRYREKYDGYLGDKLLIEALAVDRLDLDHLSGLIDEILNKP